MEKDAQYFLVGVVVSIGLAMLVGFTLWLAGTRGNPDDYARYTVYFTKSVSGLQDGASVKYKGVDVGNVIGMRFDPTREDLVKVDIEVAENTPIRAGTEAFIAMQGITGVVHLELNTVPGTDSKGEKLPQMDGEEYPVLEGHESPWAEAIDDLPVITQQVREITTKINHLLSQENIKRLTGQ